jgi:Leucine-rich repeat (LRR) protein
LTGLALSENNVTDLSPLSSLQKLSKLFLQRNRIGEISPLSNLRSLTILNISVNEIKDFSPLLNLHNLTGLFLKENKADISLIKVLMDRIKSNGGFVSVDEPGDELPF